MTWIKLILTLGVFVLSAKCQDGEAITGNPLIHAQPCVGSENIVVSYEPGLPPGQENQYAVYINRNFIKNSKVEITLDICANVSLNEKDYARIFSNDRNYDIRFFQEHDGLGFRIKGEPFGKVPYITSLKINNKQYCTEPLLGYLDQYIVGYKDSAACA